MDQVKIEKLIAQCRNEKNITQEELGEKLGVTNKTTDYKDLILEQLDLLDNINCRAMMGEYLLYYNKILFGGIYDNRLLVKIVDSNKKYNMQEQIPYESAKAMYLVDNIDNREKLKEIVIETCRDLSSKK